MLLLQSECSQGERVARFAPPPGPPHKQSAGVTETPGSRMGSSTTAGAADATVTAATVSGPRDVIACAGAAVPTVLAKMATATSVAAAAARLTDMSMGLPP